LARSALRDRTELARYLCRIYESGAEIDFQRVDRKLWGVALDRLIYEPRLDVAAFAAPRMALAFPEITYFQTMASLFAFLPPPTDDPSFAAFRDDVTREMQVVPRAGASVVLLAFCGRAQRIGMPLNMIHRWFGQLGVHFIYLRDYQRANYDKGIQSVAPDLPTTFGVLRQVIAELGASRVVCYGNSLGTYGALRYALELQAEAVLTFAGPTNLTPSFVGSSMLERMRVAPGIDLRPLYEDASCAPRAHLVYPEHEPDDRAQAENFSGLPNVTLEMALDASDHFSCLHAIFEGRYERLLEWLIDPYRSAGAP